MSGKLKTLLKWLLLSTVILAALLLGAAYYLGIWNALFPSSDHDRVAPTLPDTLGSPAILVFSKTNGFRHHDGIRGGLEAIQSMADARGWSLYATENGAVFNPQQLERFASVVFLSATGDMLNGDQEAAFETWLESGGGWLGIHAAGDGSHQSWRWYVDNLIGAEYVAHTLDPHFQDARIVVEQADHPVNRDLPGEWIHEEEWYSWASSPREQGFKILATIDESSYQPVQNLFGRERDLSMGDHPVVWTNCVGEGRSVYTAMGHQASAFEEPEIRRLLENALEWTFGSEKNDGC